ncbi:MULTISPECIES: class I SAM-dependent methyltransferase [unclassified Bradyrhizobium]|jgi:SAM-dependent methyltransferase|uniref:class I SAM-dependent methyltransferase n=1 Tax=unclassified Bradyrhizobium TaxID=2631580 RepID=UPI002916307F|nr:MULTISPECIES: class I SAM-dependent methyltransferase [unclassified Bradyrhizobium]
MHSEKYIDQSRLGWWDPTWIQHIAKACGFSHAERVCDLGAGAGHWTQVLAQALPWERTAVVALDSDPQWVEVLRDNAALAMSVAKLEVIRGDATDTGLPANSFDLVTCQTLALHLNSPAALVREMIRLAKPGGMIVMAEPINVINRAQVGAAIACLEPHEAGLLVEIWMAYHKGIRVEHNYDYDIAIRLKGIIEGCGVKSEDILCFKNPKAITILASDDLTSEYSEENFAYARKGGIDRKKWNEGRELAKRISLVRSSEVFMDSLFLFCFRAT